MLSPEGFFRNGLATIFKRMRRTHVGFNAFRRFREIGAAQVGMPPNPD
jgi:hypothetical protein